MSEIKPCPFCGGTDVVIDEGATHRWRVARCNRCEAQTGEVRVPAFDKRFPERHARIIDESVLADWNKRVTPENAEQAERIKALAAHIQESADVHNRALKTAKHPAAIEFNQASRDWHLAALEPKEPNNG